MKVLTWVFSFCLVSGCVHAQTIPSPQFLPYAQNFNLWAHSSTLYPVGWNGWAVSTAPSSVFNTAAPISDRVLIASSSASTNTGNIHNYNGKIGMLNTGSLDLALVLCLNTSSKKNILLQYDAMTIRNPYDSAANTRIRELTVQYRTDTLGAFSTLKGVEYRNNTIKQNTSGTTAPQNLVSKSIVLPSVCDSQANLQLRWITRDVSGIGLRPSFAIDNVKVDTASTLSMSTLLHAEEAAMPKMGLIHIDLSRPLKSSDSFTYTIAGTASLNIDYTISLSAGASPVLLSTDSGKIFIDTGITNLKLFINPINDGKVEGMERIQFSIRESLPGFAVKDSTVIVSLVDDELMPISSIQGSGMQASQGTYYIEAIVSSIFPLLSPSGFYLQEEELDQDTSILTSEGIFVVSDSMVHVGDKLKILGDVYEGPLYPSYNQAILLPRAITVQSKGNPVPKPISVSLPIKEVADWERYEAMLVHFPDTLTVTDQSELSRFGTITLSQGGLVYQPTQIADPNDVWATGASAYGKVNVAAIDSIKRINDLRSILLDDGRSSMMSFLPYIDSNNTLRVGSTIDSLTGIMAYAFDHYRIQPSSISAIKIKHQKRPPVPDVGHSASIKVGSFNVLNYFNGDGLGAGFPTNRGAHSLAEFARQRDKIIRAIIEMDVDILGVIEIENDGTNSLSAIQNLVDGINAYLGVGTYSFVHDGDSSQYFNTDEIRCGILFKSATVDTLGAAIVSADTIFNRPALAQKFSVKASDSVFNFIINHFKAKGCTGSKDLDKDQADGQSCYNDRRRKQADALARFINAEVIPKSRTNKVLSMGDYNAYFEEDPLDSLRSKGFTILSAKESYSYLYQGQLGSLDNAFTSNSLLPFVSGIEKWNINSVEPAYLGYEDDIDDGASDQTNFWSFLYADDAARSSDHDPVLVGLQLGAKSSTKKISPSSNELTIYPNPAKDRIYLSSNFKGQANVYIYNRLGMLLTTAMMCQGQAFIDLRHLPQGVYFIKLMNDEGYTAKAFVKE
jgi:predicted extracellular nuclease